MQVRKDLRSLPYLTKQAVAQLYLQVSNSFPAYCFATYQPRDIFYSGVESFAHEFR